MAFKKAANFKYYLYISSSKLEMLYQQVASSGKDKKSVEWGVDLKAVKFMRKSEAEDEPDTDDKLKIILREIDDAELAGTIDDALQFRKSSLRQDAA